ncbi:hypothetical protein [Streptomyces niveus]|uniref:hypothetical protein n=1 Tax=Streptomyces niveus TaxID=193462 RepID=UPI00341B960B
MQVRGIGFPSKPFDFGVLGCDPGGGLLPERLEFRHFRLTFAQSSLQVGVGGSQALDLGFAGVGGLCLLAPGGQAPLELVGQVLVEAGFPLA